MFIGRRTYLLERKNFVLVLKPLWRPVKTKDSVVFKLSTCSFFFFQTDAVVVFLIGHFTETWSLLVILLFCFAPFFFTWIKILDGYTIAEHFYLLEPLATALEQRLRFFISWIFIGPWYLWYFLFFNFFISGGGASRQSYQNGRSWIVV